MNSKAILLATAIFSIALSASAVADSYYFRSKGSPIANAPGNPETPETARCSLPCAALLEGPLRRSANRQGRCAPAACKHLAMGAGDIMLRFAVIL
jgi:hypothetical protein